MTRYVFAVTFEDSDKISKVIVKAFSEEEAIILAKAERIRDGKRYDNFKSCKNLSETMYYPVIG